MFCKFILADTALNVSRQFQTFTLRPFYNVRTAFTFNVRTGFNFNIRTSFNLIINIANVRRAFVVGRVLVVRRAFNLNFMKNRN